ncbi:hypothetical protein D3C87_1996850 [compost metagenome]
MLATSNAPDMPRFRPTVVDLYAALFSKSVKPNVSVDSLFFAASASLAITAPFSCVCLPT